MVIFMAKKLIYGVGIDDLDYKKEIRKLIGGKKVYVWRCQFFSYWKNMLNRCYSGEKKNYIDCYVCDQWLTFSSFKAWMEKQDWMGKQLDKDILVKNNKVYSPDTCVFVSHKTNSFILESNGNRGNWPIGVSFERRRGKFEAYCSNPGNNKKVHLGYFDDCNKAHMAWKAKKLEFAKIIAEEQSNKDVAHAIIARYL